MKMTQIRDLLRVGVLVCVMALLLLSVALGALSQPRPPRVDDSYGTLINEAAEAVTEKQYSVAIEKCNQAIHLAPKRAPAYLWKGIALGYVYINRGENNLSRRNEAISNLNKFLYFASKDDASRATAQGWIARIKRPFPPKPIVIPDPAVAPNPLKTPKPIITPQPTITPTPIVTPESSDLSPPQLDYLDPPLQPQLPVMEHSNTVGAIAFAPDGRTLASGSWKSGSWKQGESQVCEIKLWDMSSGDWGCRGAGVDISPTASTRAAKSSAGCSDAGHN